MAGQKTAGIALADAHTGRSPRALGPPNGIDVAKAFATVIVILIGRIDPGGGVAAQADDATQAVELVPGKIAADKAARIAEVCALAPPAPTASG